MSMLELHEVSKTYAAQLATWPDRPVFLRVGEMTDQPATAQVGTVTASRGE
jgi:hypothetical protein